MEDETNLRQRKSPDKIRVIFPDGTTYCFTSVKETFIQTLKKIGAEKFQHSNLEIGHLPIFSKEIYTKYRKYMEPVTDGWYVNTQSNTEQKYRQLLVLNNQFDLNLTIDMGDNLKGEKVNRGTKNISVLKVTFGDGHIIAEENTMDTFIECVQEIGIDEIMKKNIMHGGNPIITTTQKYKGQIQIDIDRWLIVPSSIKSKVKVLKVISAMLNIKMDIFFL